MPSIRAEMAADVAAAITLYGQTFEWSGRTIDCVRRDQPTARELQDAGGFIDGVQFFLVVAKAAFPDSVFPLDGDLLNDSAHQVKAVNGHKDPGAAQLVLSVGSVDT